MAAGMLEELYRRAASPLLLLVLLGANKPLLASPFMGKPTRWRCHLGFIFFVFYLKDYNMILVNSLKYYKFRKYKIYLKSFWLLIIKLTDIRCTKKLQVAIGSIIEKRYPVKRPPRLQQAVDRALGKMQT